MKPAAAANLALDSARAKMGAAASWFCIIVLKRGRAFSAKLVRLSARHLFSFGDGVNRIFAFDYQTVEDDR